MERDERATQALTQMRAGDGAARGELMTLLYDELRALARSCVRAQPGTPTLQPTALVHEAYLKLLGDHHPNWNDRAHFLAVAATAMRQVLVDHVRAKHSAKRGGGEWKRATLDRVLDVLEAQHVDAAELEAALVKLAGLSARQARVVELRVFAGLTLEESALALDVGVTTVKTEWQFARAWLKRELSKPGALEP